MVKNKDQDQILNPVEILATVAGIFITAIGIPITQQSGYTAFLGSALSVMGTMLSSATGAWVIARKQSGEQFKDQLASIQRHLHATVSKMQSAVSEGLDSDTGDEQLALTKMQELTDGLKVVLADIAGLSGHSLDLQRETMTGIMEEIFQLQGVLERAVEVERSEADEDQTETLLTELQQKLTELQQKVEADVHEINKLPSQSKMPKLKPASVQPEMTPFAKCLAAMRRRLDMQHLGPKDQLSVLRNMHQILVSKRIYRSLKDITEDTLQVCIEEACTEKRLAKNSVGGVLRVLRFADVLDLKNLPGVGDAPPMNLYQIKDEFVEFNALVVAHDTCVLAFADYFRLSPGEFESRLMCAGSTVPDRGSDRYLHFRNKVAESLMQKSG